MPKKGLYSNIHAKRKRIKAGSGETMRKPGSKGAPTTKSFKQAAKTARNNRRAQLQCSPGSGQALRVKLRSGCIPQHNAIAW